MIPSLRTLLVRLPATLLWVSLLLPGTALAHSFGRSYALPLPVWIYQWSAAATLLLSFAVIGLTARPADVALSLRQREIGASRGFRVLLALGPLWAALGVALFALCLATGALGTTNPYRNFSMTWFWIVVLLGLGYFSALLGPVYGRLSPFTALADGAAWLIRLWPRLSARVQRWQRPYPARWSYWPAVLLYLALLWVELFVAAGPRLLAELLGAYLLLTLIGTAVFGRVWLERAELFAVLFGLFARMAPLACTSDEQGRRRWHLRAPGAGLIDAPLPAFSLLVFLMLMLASTVVDSLLDTTIWYRWFWTDFYVLVRDWAGHDPLTAWHRLAPLAELRNGLALLLSPWLYLGLFLAALWLMQRLAPAPGTLLQRALAFAPSLLPIALAYHLSHYLGLFVTQVQALPWLLDDPFGWRWSLLGLGGPIQRPWIPEPGWIWGMQVYVILAGHVVSVYVAHLQAMQIYGCGRTATRSQLPMLLLMLAYTVFGLWILAQDIQS